MFALLCSVAADFKTGDSELSDEPSPSLIRFIAKGTRMFSFCNK